MAFLWFLAQVPWCYSLQMKQSMPMIEGVEKFRLQNDRVPTEEETDSLKKALSLPTGMRCPGYRVNGPEGYMVWFGTSLGSSYTFHSFSREWKEEG